MVEYTLATSMELMKIQLRILIIGENILVLCINDFSFVFHGNKFTVFTQTSDINPPPSSSMHQFCGIIHKELKRDETFHMVIPCNEQGLPLFLADKIL